MRPTSYQVGKWLASNWIVLLLAAAVGAVIWLLQGVFSAPPVPPRQLQPQASQSEGHRPAESAYAQLKRRCTEEQDMLRQKAEAHLKKREFQAAYDSLHECRMFTADKNFLKVYEAATVALTRETARANAKAEQERKAARKKEGVTIGMSQQEVVESNWGRPRKINRTTRASGTSEQWVYDGGYLYFENGILTAIQN